LCGLASCDQRFDFDVPSDAGASPRAASPVACQSDADCVLQDLHCDVTSGLCFECVVDADCGSARAPLCDRALHACVQCAVDENCETGFACDPVLRRCRQSCEQKSDCSGDYHGCDVLLGVCIVCDDDDECGPSAPHCDAARSACTECASDAHCARGQHCNLLSGGCVECRDSRDCASPDVCDPSNHRCVSG
jgi:hypothetical protein